MLYAYFYWCDNACLLLYCPLFLCTNPTPFGCYENKAIIIIIIIIIVIIIIIIIIIIKWVW